MKRTNSLVSLMLAASFVIQAPLAVWADQQVLKEGTPVRLKVLQTLSSKSNHEGDMIDFEVLENVMSEDGKTVLIKAGTAARGSVGQVEERGRMGKSGELNILVDSTKAVNGAKVPLRASMNREGKDSTGSVIALSLIVSPLFLLKRGKDASIPAGTEIRSFVNNDITMNLDGASSMQSASTQDAEPTKTEANTSDYLKKYTEKSAKQGTTESASAEDNLKQLEALARLRKQGTITEAEFQAKKKQLLGL